MALGNFHGLRVLALESRRAAEVAKLIRTYGGEPTVAPAMREVPLDSNHEALEFCERLLRGDFDLVIFTTGVGARKLLEIASTRFEPAQLVEALRRVKIITRGPKSSAAVREMGLTVTAAAPDPRTWREGVGALDSAFGSSLAGLRAAVQEYGVSNPELLEALSSRQVKWTRVPVYQWALPIDLEPLRSAIRSIAGGDVDVIVFLTAVQVAHLFEVAGEMDMTAPLREGIRNALILSIGPSTTEGLARYDIPPDFEPSSPKMGILMNEAAACAEALLAEKRARKRG
jgi:uroporphyrinogen-III synthase